MPSNSAGNLPFAAALNNLTFEGEFGVVSERLEKMAQRVNVVLVDDIDEGDADETVQFGLDGVDYEIDVSAEHAEQLREALALYVAHGRRVGRRQRGGTGGGGRRTAGNGGSSSSNGGPSAADVRAWARENGWEVPERGRVSAEVREAYSAAH